MSKGQKWMIALYIVCFIIIVASVFCAIALFKEVKAESYVNGSIDISNKFSQESFYYSSSNVVFYKDGETEDTYIFQKELLKVDDFDGQEKKYKVELNDFVMLDVEQNAGSIYAQHTIDFYGTEGELACEGTLDISIKFYSNKTVLKLSTQGASAAQFFEQYFYDNGIRLKVTEIF